MDKKNKLTFDTVCHEIRTTPLRAQGIEISL